ncbi:hypothetical protein MASR2M64_01210 [Candidatus Cloacimonadota bacterium]
MKRLLLVVALFLIVLSLCADEVDDVLSTICNSTIVYDHHGESVLMGENLFIAESDAYAWVAECALVALALKANWVGNSSANASKVRSVDAIGAAWETPYQTFVLSIPVWEIMDHFNDDDHMTSDELADDILDYIEYHGDVSPISMY